MLFILEQERRTEQPQFRAELTRVAERRQGQIERAQMQPFDLLGRVTELCRREDRDLYRSAGSAGSRQPPRAPGSSRSPPPAAPRSSAGCPGTRSRSCSQLFCSRRSPRSIL